MPNRGPADTELILGFSIDSKDTRRLLDGSLSGKFVCSADWAHYRRTNCRPSREQVLEAAIPSPRSTDAPPKTLKACPSVFRTREVSSLPDGSENAPAAGGDVEILFGGEAVALRMPEPEKEEVR